MSKLPHHHNVHKFRPKGNLVDDSVLDDETRRALMREIMDAPRAQQKQSPIDENLLAMLTQRLKSLEERTVILQKELKEKSMKIISLEDHLKEETTRRRDVERERDALAEQIDDMQEFLADYDLTWVGKKKPEAFNLYEGAFDVNAVQMKETQTKECGEAPSLVVGPNVSKAKESNLPFDIELLKRNSLMLSAHVGQMEVGKGDGRANIIKERDTVHVCVYSNGICVNSGPFRPFGWSLCEAFLGDILEGFYPYEFKDKYPDGFPLNVIDKSNEECPQRGAPGAKGNIATVDQLHDHGFKPISRETLLKRLPERYVTASGQLVNIRQGVEQFMTGGTAQAPQKHAAAELAHTVTSGPAQGEETAKEKKLTTALQVKLPQGNKVVLYMFRTNTIHDVHRELEEAAQGAISASATPYELCTVFPRMTLDRREKTLEELGMFPSCTLLVKFLSLPSA